MTTSGATAFNPTRDDMIRRSLRILGAIQSGETPGAQEITDASEALNGWVKEQEASGLHLWAEVEGVAFLQPRQYNYGLGGGSTDHITLATDLGTTSLISPAAQGTTTLAANSGTPLVAIGDRIGILLVNNNNTLFWSTVTDIPGTITIADPLPVAADTGSLIYYYANQINRPLRIVNGRRFQLSSNIDTPMIMMSRVDYREQPNKTNTGVITQYFYDPQLVTGQLWLWPNPPDSTLAFKFTWMRSLQDFLTASNTADFPQEWVNAIVWNLAVELIPEYDVPPGRQDFLVKRALASLELLQTWDKEPESIYFGVNFDQTVR